MRCACHLVVITLTLAVATVAVAGQTLTENAVDPAGWVSADALAYVGIADTGKLGDEFQQTAVCRIMRDPDLQDAHGRLALVSRFYDDLRNRLAQSLGAEPDQLENPFGGPMALYVPAPSGKTDDDLQLVLVAGVANPELMRGYYDRAVDRFSETTHSHQQLVFDGYTVDRFTTNAAAAAMPGDESEDASEALGPDSLGADDEVFAAALHELLGNLLSADGMPEEFVLCLTTDRLVVAPAVEDVKGVLERSETNDSLLETETYQTLLREFKPLGSVRLLIDVAGLFKLMEAVEGDEARDALTMLGARSMRGVIGHILFGGKEFESKIEALLLLDGERIGLAKIFSMENRAITPAASVSADSLVYASVNANPPEVLDELERMIRQEDPKVADELRASMESLALPDGETLHLRTEVLDDLRGPLTFALAFQPPYEARSAGIRLALGHRDRGAIARFLARLSVASSGMMIERAVPGTLVYDVPLIGFSLAPTENAVIVGTTNAVDTAVEGPAPQWSLAEDPAFKRVAALAPSEASVVFYVDSRRMFEAAVELARAKDTPTPALLAGPAKRIALQVVERLAWGIDPDGGDAVRRLSGHLAPRIITMATVPDGIRLTQIQLTPDSD